MTLWITRGQGAQECQTHLRPILSPEGSPSPRLDGDEFRRRFLDQFQDPAYEALAPELTKIKAAAWDAYKNSRKSPRTRKAGVEFAHPDYDLAADWLDARQAIHEAKRRYDDQNGQIGCSSSTALPAASIPVLAKSLRVSA